MFLQNVIFARFFTTNIVSQVILDNKNIYLGFENLHSYKKSRIKYILHKTNGHYIFSASAIPHSYPHNVTNIKPLFEPSISAFNVLAINAEKKRSVLEWHQIMGHVLGETFKHLISSVENVKIVPGIFFQNQ